MCLSPVCMKKIGGDFFHLYNGGHALPGLCGDSKIAYVIDQSCASYTYWWFLINRIMAYGSMNTTWKMSLRDCSLESPFSSVHDIYCQGDHNPVSPKGARHRQPWTCGCFAHRWQLQGRRACSGLGDKPEVSDPPLTLCQPFHVSLKGSCSLLGLLPTTLPFSPSSPPQGGLSLYLSPWLGGGFQPIPLPWGPPQHLAHSSCPVNL